MSDKTQSDRFISPKKRNNEDNTLIRPQRLDDFTGQDNLKANLSILIEAAKGRQEPLDHVLFHGPPGLGKTTLAHIVANELGVNIYSTSGPVIERSTWLSAAK